MGFKLTNHLENFLRHSAAAENPFSGMPEPMMVPTPALTNTAVARPMETFSPVTPSIATRPAYTALNSPVIAERTAAEVSRVQAAIAEVTTREIQAKHALGKKITLQNGAALALKMDETLHPATSSIVTKDPLRQATTEELQGPNKQVVWAETNGVAELGKGVKGTLPVGGFAKANAGFSASALLNYHTIQPVVTNTEKDLPEVEKTPTLVVPMTREELVERLPGTEFDIRGKGTVVGRASVDAGGSLVPGIDVGANASVGASVKHKGEASVNIRFLSDPGLVQMTVNSVEEDEKRVGVDLKAGYKVPDVGHGFLMHLVENAIETPLRRLMRTYTSASASVEAKTTETDTNLGRYTLDIESPNGLAAYRALLQLSTEKADMLSGIDGSGVSRATYEETSNVNEFKATAQVSGKRLLLLQALDSEKRGKAEGAGGEFLVFRENKFSHQQNDPIEGPKTAHWDALSVRTEEGGEFENFFNMKFSAQDKFTTDDEVRRFFKFAEVLGVRPKDETINALPEMGVMERIFSDADDTNVKVDIYFTAEGIDNIDQCTRPEARKAYLENKAHFFPKTEGLVDILEDKATYQSALKKSQSFEDLERERFLEDSGYALESALLVRDYGKETGRDLRDDYKALLGARRFAVLVETLDGEKGVNNIREFFSGLGKSQGPLYMTALASLASLATRKETMVNQLSMDGKHIHIEAVSEGKMEHPTETVKQIIDEKRYKLTSFSKDEGSEV